MDTRGAPLRASLVSVCLLLASVLGVTAPAGAEGEKDLVLPGCGICYPGGYDPNTVGEVGGRVAEIVVPDNGPVRFTVSGDEERWVVLASPAWFWKSTGVRLSPGDTVAVRGSKSLGADGRLYIVAQSISLQGRQPALVLRDARGLPLWRGQHGGGGMQDGGHGRR
jgi:hypothetical protein